MTNEKKKLRNERSNIKQLSLTTKNQNNKLINTQQQ